MKRVAMLCLGLALGAASVAEAQLTMQMSNGWTFSFAGNVNAFAIYETQNEDGATVAPGGTITPSVVPSSLNVSYVANAFTLPAKVKLQPLLICIVSWASAAVAAPRTRPMHNSATRFIGASPSVKK